jgi:hypothetical protein
MGVKLVSNSGGSVEINPPDTASNFTQTLVPVTGTLAPLVSGTAVASTSGTSIDFTGIPSWVKRITVMFNGVSTNGTANIRFQLGTSSGVTSSGYVGAAANVQNGNATIGAAYAGGGFDLTNNTATVVQYGAVRFVNQTGNTWVADGVFSRTTAANGADFTAGSVALSGTLDRVRITTVNGTDTFDAGSINIMYE